MKTLKFYAVLVMLAVVGLGLLPAQIQNGMTPYMRALNETNTSPISGTGDVTTDQLNSVSNLLWQAKVAATNLSTGSGPLMRSNAPTVYGATFLGPTAFSDVRATNLFTSFTNAILATDANGVVVGTNRIDAASVVSTNFVGNGLNVTNLSTMNLVGIYTSPVIATNPSAASQGIIINGNTISTYNNSWINLSPNGSGYVQAFGNGFLGSFMIVNGGGLFSQNGSVTLNSSLGGSLAISSNIFLHYTGSTLNRVGFTNGVIYATNGLASFASATPIPIAATGWTNIWSTNMAIVEFTGTITSWTNRSANFTTGLRTNVAAVTWGQSILQPGQSVTITGTGVEGCARPF